MYKDRRFRARPVADVLADLETAREAHPHVPSLFLADGNAIALPTAHLLTILDRATSLFPELEHIGMYGGARYLAPGVEPGLGEPKSSADLEALRAAGLSMIYLGLESGDDETLRRVKKGVIAEDMIAAGHALKDAGFPVSLYVLIGLGGRERSQQHAQATAAAINAIRPDIVRPRTLYIQEHTPLWHQRRRGDFVEVGPREALLEVRIMLERIEVPVTLLSDHISNYLPLKGRLPADREALIASIDRTLAHDDLSGLRPDHFDHL